MFAVRWRKPKTLLIALGEKRLKELTRHRVDLVEVHNSMCCYENSV